jgi:hypothetical protein
MWVHTAISRDKYEGRTEKNGWCREYPEVEIFPMYTQTFESSNYNTVSDQRWIQAEMHSTPEGC